MLLNLPDTRNGCLLAAGATNGRVAEQEWVGFQWMMDGFCGRAVDASQMRTLPLQPPRSSDDVGRGAATRSRREAA